MWLTWYNAHDSKQLWPTASARTRIHLVITASTEKTETMGDVNVNDTTSKADGELETRSQEAPTNSAQKMGTNENGTVTKHREDEYGHYFGDWPQEDAPANPITTEDSAPDLEDPANYVIRPKRTGNHELIMARREPWTVFNGTGNPETFDIASSIGDEQDKASSVGDFEFLDMDPSQIPPGTVIGHITVEKREGDPNFHFTWEGGIPANFPPTEPHSFKPPGDGVAASSSDGAAPPPPPPPLLVSDEPTRRARAEAQLGFYTVARRRLEDEQSFDSEQPEYH